MLDSSAVVNFETLLSNIITILMGKNSNGWWLFITIHDPSIKLTSLTLIIVFTNKAMSATSEQWRMQYHSKLLYILNTILIAELITFIHAVCISLADHRFVTNSYPYYSELCYDIVIKTSLLVT